MDNVFLIGCSRSGTTLLQSMLATHKQIISFPETHFFTATMPINPILRRLKPYGKKDRKKVIEFLKTYDFNPALLDIKSKKRTHYSWSCILIYTLQKMAEHNAEKNQINNPASWLEKTPRHLHYISTIKNTGCNPKFIHMLREGKNVMASMHLASKKHPKEWKGVRSIKKCIKWWNIDINKSLKYQGLPNHVFAVYEQLVDNPQTVIKALCPFLNVEYNPKMVTQFHQSACELIAKEEKWKARNTNQTLTESTKLQDNFDESTIKYITQKTDSIDLSAFYH